VPDGLFTRADDDGGVVFREGPAPTRADIAAVAARVEKRMRRWLRRRGLLDERAAEDRSNEAPELSPPEACMQLSLFGSTFCASRQKASPSLEAGRAAAPLVDARHALVGNTAASGLEAGSPDRDGRLPQHTTVGDPSRHGSGGHPAPYEPRSPAVKQPIRAIASSLSTTGALGRFNRCTILSALFLVGCASKVEVASDGASSSASEASSGPSASSGTGTIGSGGAGGTTASASSSGAGGSGISAPLTIPAAGSRDMVYDAKRHRLYITTGGAGGAVLAYNLVTQQFETPLLTGGSFSGIDLSPDEDEIVVADQNSDADHNWIYRIDLAKGTSQKITFGLEFGEGGTFTTVFTSGTEALVSSDYNGSGSTPLRKVDLTSGTAQSVKTVNQATMLVPSADGSTVAYAESNISSGAWGRYDIDASTFADSPGTKGFVYEIAVSRTASQFAVPTYSGLFIYDGAFAQKTKLGVYADELPVGAVYSPVADELYLAWYGGSTSIDVYSATTFTKLRDIEPTPGLFEWNGNYAFVSGRLRISRDGSLIFATSGDSVLVYPTGP
jgi:hypothetical protein